MQPISDLLSVHVSFSWSQLITCFSLDYPQALLNSALVSANPVETPLNNAEQFMLIDDYRTSAMLYTVALQHLEADSSPTMVANILCKRAECLLRLVSTFLSG